MTRFARILIFVLCLGPAVASAEMSESEFTPVDTPERSDLFPLEFARGQSLPRDFHRPPKKTLALDLGSKLVELRANYWEERRQDPLPLGGLTGALSDSGPPRSPYFDLFAKSAPLGGILVGESELAYSGLPGSSPLTEHLPIMSRVGLNGRWGKAGYGASYRSFGAGFVPLTGARVEHERDESQLWGEYDFGMFRLRGAAGETWERNSATHDLTLTRTAAATLRLARPLWSTMFSSSYSWIGHGESPGYKTFAFANGFALAYRPVPLFTIEPSVAFRQEREPVTGFKKDTPSAGLALAYAPHRDFRLIGRASYTRDLSDDPLKNASTVNTSAGLNWNLGRSFLGRQSLTMQFEYKNESRPAVPDNQQAQFIGSVQFKIAGF